ncbi:MAG: hypothetical protein WBL68_01635 [Nitrososphaeraceae archaeon]
MLGFGGDTLANIAVINKDRVYKSSHRLRFSATQDLYLQGIRHLAMSSSSAPTDGYEGLEKVMIKCDACN